jgi:hypothetical protein
MSTWKKVIRYSLRVDGKFENQYSTQEAAQRQAAKYQAKGKTTSIKEVEVESMAVSFGVI